VVAEEARRWWWLAAARWGLGVTDLEGKILGGRYQLGPLLGVGGMASVYPANDRVLQRQVAVKLLSPPHAQDPSFVERFRRETRTAARLGHPNVVAVFDSGSDAGLHYLVMEYVPGESLAQLLARRGRLAPRRAAELAIQVCAALAAAHAPGAGAPRHHPRQRAGRPGRAGEGDRLWHRQGGRRHYLDRDRDGAGDGCLPVARAGPGVGRVDARSDLYGLGCAV
jgi:hypothetical protein